MHLKAQLLIHCLLLNVCAICAKTLTPTLESKIEGMLIGSAIGDAAGGPVEFVSPPNRSYWSVTREPITPEGLEDLASRFEIPAYPKKAEPFAQWIDDAPAGTITDDTRFKIIFFNALKKYGPNLNQKHFAQAVMDFRDFLKPEFRDNFDKWIPEIAFATLWALGDKEKGLPVERIWGGIPTMEGQMPFLPIAALKPEDPAWCYQKCYELGYFDIGVAKDHNSALRRRPGPRTATRWVLAKLRSRHAGSRSLSIQ